MSGPQPALPEIKDTVMKGGMVLRNGPPKCSFNGLTWAICVLGSMADEVSQPIFSNVLTSMIRTSGRLGNSTAVLEVLEKCWSMPNKTRPDCSQVMYELDMHVLLI